MLPKVLVVDDLFGRAVSERRNLCKLYGLEDITGDDAQPFQIDTPLAEAVFSAAQYQNDNSVENNVDIALSAVKEGWPFANGGYWSLVLLDLQFVSGPVGVGGEPEGRTDDDTFGLRILEALKREFPDLPVIILSSRERAEVIEECRNLGAADFIQRHSGLTGQAPRELLASKLFEYGLLEDERNIIVGQSLPLLKVLAAARRAATGGGNILILGETGTGKELLANYIHQNSPKATGPYKVFHAFGTSENLQEDLLFGHVKGAFTDAKKDRQGLFEQSSGGTLFIDEVGDISESLQNKLLRPIETRQVSRMGADVNIDVDLQLVLVTNKELDEYAETGRFKFDLLNRIRAYTVALPSLNERREDILLLANTLLEKLCHEYDAQWPRSIHPDALEKLLDHDWHEGNVRELRNVLERVIKDNKNSEIVVAGDVRFDSMPRAVTEIELESESDVSLSNINGLDTEIDEWLKGLREIPVDGDYAFLHGSWPPLKREIAFLLARYLASAIEATRKRRAEGPPEGEINLTGAVSCLLGRQVPTVQAADFVKRFLQYDEETSEEILKESTVLSSVLEQALRFRPKKSVKLKNNNGSRS